MAWDVLCNSKCPTPSAFPVGSSPARVGSKESLENGRSMQVEPAIVHTSLTVTFCFSVFLPRIRSRFEAQIEKSNESKTLPAPTLAAQIRQFVRFSLTANILVPPGCGLFDRTTESNPGR